MARIRNNSRPTETRAVSSIINDEAYNWIRKIDKCYDIESTTIILRELITKIQNGEIPKDVLEVVITKRTVRASIDSILKEM